MADHWEHYSSSRSTVGSIQAPLDTDVAPIGVGENREHLSLLSSGRRHASQSIRVNSLTAGLAPTSSQDGNNNYTASNSLSVSLPLRYRMTNYYRLIFNRHPRGKGVLLVFLLYFLETFAFFGALNGVKHLLPDQSNCNNDNSSGHNLSSFVFSLLFLSAGRVFYPVGGIIADSYLGRHNVIHIGLWLLWIGFAVNSLSFTFLLTSMWSRYTVVTITFLLFGAGSGSVEATLIPFGVDQLSQGASSDELSSYFYYYYMARNVAAMSSTLIFFIDFDLIDFFPQSDLSNCTTVTMINTDIQYTVQSVLALVAISIALLILFCMKNQLYHDRQHSNALKLICNVLSFAATVKRQIPLYNRAFRYGEGRKPRIELAKREYDGIFSSEEVEDVKTCYRMLFLLLSLFGYFVTYGAVSIKKYPVANWCNINFVINFCEQASLNLKGVCSYVLH